MLAISLICMAIGINNVMALDFKTEKLVTQFEKAPMQLKQITCDFARLANQLGITPVVTRVTDYVKGSSGVHESGRAVDIRGQYKGRHVHSKDARRALVSFINARYQRRDDFKACMYHRLNSLRPFHYHLQISRLTTDMGGPK